MPCHISHNWSHLIVIDNDNNAYFFFSIRVSEQQVLNLPQDPKDKLDESSRSCATTPQSARPASVCSSVSSGYASDEGDSSPLSTFTNNDSICDERNIQFTRLVQDLRQQAALEQLAQQKFDFSVSCISPNLKRLQTLKLQDVQETARYNNNCVGTPRRKCAVASRGDKIMDFTLRQKQMCSLENKENDVDLNNNNSAQQCDELKTGCSSADVDQNMQQTCGEQINIQQLNIRPRVHRSYSEAVPIRLLIADVSSCDLQKNRELLTPEATPCSTRNTKLSTFQRFSKDRRSWAPGSSLSTQYSDNAFSGWGNRSSFRRRSLAGDMFEEDSLSVVSDVSTMSAESSMSSMSTASVPVHGRHASKKRYHKLRDLFKQFRSKPRG